MARMLRRKLVTIVPAVAVALALAAPAATARPARAAPRDAGTTLAAKQLGRGAPRRVSPAVQRPAHVPAGDELVAGTGDTGGWHLYAASSGDTWRWHLLATLRPSGYGDESWIGQQCLTGDGRYVVAVVAPWHANNSEAGVDAGGLGYTVDAHTGAVRPLVSGVSLAYFNPGCGTGSQVAFTTYLGRDEGTTRVTVLDAADGRVARSATVGAEITSAVPVDGQILAARGGAVVRLTAGRADVVGRVAGHAFDLRPNVGGGVDLVTATGRAARIWRLASGVVRQVGSGPLGQVRLLAGRADRTLVMAATVVTPVPGLSAVRAVPDAMQAAVSLDGGVVLAGVSTHPGHGTKTAVTLALEPAHSGAARVSQSPPPAPATTRLPTLDLRTRGLAGRAAPNVNTTQPGCAVPRNDLWNQVPQPNSAQIQWAVQQAVHGWLAPGDVPARPTAPQNYKIVDSQPLPSYFPSSDFPPGALSGNYPGATVPPQVMYGIFAQESNWNQASFHALAGYGGNPLIANYYGSSNPANPTDINYDNADCGYGIGQLTDIMKAGAISVATQVAVATDYAENIAAASQALVTKWNQLAGLGDTMNNGDPSKLENWYGAIWAYNSGVHLGNGGYGLGWFNNPANPIYPVGRHPFLHQLDSSGNPVATYTDASTPQYWPYQEKVFGWMETPQTDPNYDPANPTTPPSSPFRYAGTYDWSTGTGQFLALPGAGTFCSLSVNNCTPASIGSSDPCPAENSSCWWNQPAQWVDCSAGCTSQPPGGPAPSPATPEPARMDRGVACADTRGLPASAIIVDDTALTSQNPSGLDPNVVGCPTTPSGWSQGGTFQLDTNNGTPGQLGHQIGVPDVAAIDLHQLGAGFGGHTWFTHTRPASDASHEVVAEWIPGVSTGLYQIKVYVPTPGATTTQATYQVHLTAIGKVVSRTIDQNAYANQWVSLGLFPIRTGDYVTLGSVTPASDISQGADIAFTAMAFVPIAVGDGITVTSNPATDYSFSDGWGVSLAWWAEALGGSPNTGGPWSPAYRTAIEQALFGPPRTGGLGLNIVRYNIGASPATNLPAGCPALRPGAQVPSPQQASGGTVDITRDAGQLTVLKDAIAGIKAAGGSPTLEAFANSPPWWMTWGCPNGYAPVPGVLSNNLQPKYYSAYPAYLTQVLQRFEAAGIHFQTVEPFNEPGYYDGSNPYVGVQWGGTSCSNGNKCQESANFLPSLQDSQIRQLCADLASAGLSTQVAAPDGNSVDETVRDYNFYSSQAQGCISKINSHGYVSNRSNGPTRLQLASLASSGGKDLWMSEYGTGGIATDMGSAVTLSTQIAQDFQYLRPKGWVYWQGVEAFNRSGPKWGLFEGDNFPLGAPVTLNPAAGSPATRATMRFYALGQYSEFIRPGFQILSASDPSTNGTLTVAAYNPNGSTIVLVTTNSGSSSRSVAYDLSQLADIGIPVGSVAHVYRTAAGSNLAQQPDLTISGGILTDNQPGQSVTTYVINP